MLTRDNAAAGASIACEGCATAAELRTMLAAEAAQIVDHLLSEASQLGEGRPDPSLIAAIAGDVHALKGALTPIGLSQVVRVVEAMEDAVASLGSDHDLRSEVAAALNVALRSLPKFVSDLLAGHQITRQAAALEATLIGLAEPSHTEPSHTELSHTEPSDTEPSSVPTMVRFRTAHGDFAIDVEHARGVVGGRGIVPLPQRRDGKTTSPVVGLVEHRGALVPVVSILGANSARAADHGCGHVLILADGVRTVGLLVERVLKVAPCDDPLVEILNPAVILDSTP